MLRGREVLPQFNWPVLGPLIVVLALIVGVSGFIVTLTATGTRTNAPRRPAGESLAGGTGGGADLRPPELVRSQLFSLSARVNGAPTIRRGPGTQYPVVAKAVDGQEFHVIACSAGCEWLRVFSLTDDGQWWLPAVFLSVSGATAELPVLTPSDSSGGR